MLSAKATNHSSTIFIVFKVQKLYSIIEGAKEEWMNITN